MFDVDSLSLSKDQFGGKPAKVVDIQRCESHMRITEKRRNNSPLACSGNHLIDSLTTVRSIDFSWTNNKQTLPVELLEFLFRGQFGSTVRSRISSRTASADEDKVTTTFRSNRGRQARRRLDIDWPVTALINGMSYCGAMDDDIELATSQSSIQI